MSKVRTTVSLDPDTEALLKEAMRREGIGFKAAVNRAIRAGLAPAPGKPFRQRTFELGARPAIGYVKTLQLAGSMENEELAHKLNLGK